MRTELFQWHPPAPRSRDMRWSEEVVITSAIAAYRACVADAYVLTERPDRRQRNAPEADAIVKGPGLPPLAIEHTRLETFAGELMDDARVDALLVPLQKELEKELPAGLWCSVPIHAFQVGRDWSNLTTRIA